MKAPAALTNGWWIALLSFALGLRLLLLFLMNTTPLQLIYPHMDGDGYLTEAAAIQNGTFWLSENHLERMPLYPALIALLALLPGDTTITVQIWHTLLDVCTLGCIIVFAQRTVSGSAAWWAGLLYAVYPLALYRLPLMNVEVISGTLLAMFGLGLYLWDQNRSTLGAVALSVILAMLLYVNPAFQALPILLLGIALWRIRFAQFWRYAVAFLLPIVLICAAWGVRNQMITGQFYLFDIRSGHAFWIGNYQPAEGRWEGELRPMWEARFNEIKQRVAAEPSDKNDERYRFQQALYREGLQEIMNDPIGAAVLVIKKFWRFWFVPASESRLLVSFVVQSFYLLLAITGVWLLRRDPIAWVIPVLLIAYAAAVYSASYACLRFSHPLMPWVCALGGATVQAIAQRIQPSRDRHE